MAWATTDDVYELTGTGVTTEDIREAQGVIDVFSGVTESASTNLQTRDKRLLKMAVAYQSAWGNTGNRKDLFTRDDVSTLQQDGMGMTLTDSDASVLAPLARRCLRQLSWRRSRSIRIRPQRRRVIGSAITDEDCAQIWRRL